MRLCSSAQAGSIAGKSGDRAAVIDVVAMGLRQIPAYVAPKGGGRFIDGRSCVLGKFGSAVDHRRSKDLGNQGGFRLKVIIEAALRKAGLLHQLIQPDGLDAALSEKLGCRGNDRAAVFRSPFSRNPQSLILEFVTANGPSLAYQDCGRNRQSRSIGKLETVWAGPREVRAADLPAARRARAKHRARRRHREQNVAIQGPLPRPTFPGSPRRFAPRDDGSVKGRGAPGLDNSAKTAQKDNCDRHRKSRLDPVRPAARRRL